jgi:hypothetical protein
LSLVEIPMIGKRKREREREREMFENVELAVAESGLKSPGVNISGGLREIRVWLTAQRIAFPLPLPKTLLPLDLQTRWVWLHP